MQNCTLISCILLKEKKSYKKKKQRIISMSTKIEIQTHETKNQNITLMQSNIGNTISFNQDLNIKTYLILKSSNKKINTNLMH